MAAGTPVHGRDRGSSRRKQGNRGAEPYYIKQDGEIRYVIRKSLAQLQPTDIDKMIDDAVRDRVREAIDEVGFKTAMNPDEYTIWKMCIRDRSPTVQESLFPISRAVLIVRI